MSSRNDSDTRYISFRISATRLGGILPIEPYCLNSSLTFRTRTAKHG